MLNYLEQKNYFWRMHDVYSFSTAEIALYFHLLEICDKCAWRNPFKRQNTKICSGLGITKPTLERARNRLKQSEMIDFTSNGKGDPNIRYELKKARNFTTSVTSFDTTSVTSFVHINKDLEEDKKIKVVAYADAIAFFLETRNFRSLTEKKFGGARESTEAHFKIFYDDKADLGEFDNKTPADLVRHFSFWLPDYLRAKVREKTKEAQGTGSRQTVNGFEGDKRPESKTEAALRRHEELLSEFEKNGK